MESGPGPEELKRENTSGISGDLSEILSEIRAFILEDCPF